MIDEKYLFGVAACALMFVACGDDVTEVTEVTKIHQDGIAVLEAGEKLSKQACDTANVGEVLFVTDSSAAFVCDGESWQTLKGEKGEAGADGEDGTDGSSCTATVNQDGNFDLVCDGKKVGTITNGADGLPGGDGTGCTLKDNEDGTVTVTCGEGDDATTEILYKAVCGTAAYDPAKSFCSEGELYSCGDKPYDPEKQYCLEVTRNETKIYSVEALLTDARDEQNIQVYKTVKICNDDETSCQTWMAENLNYAYTGVTFDVNGSTSDSTSWCYGNDASNCGKYGRLYTWSAVMDSAAQFSVNAGTKCGYGKTCTPKTPHRGICPEGWHVPTKDEFSTLYGNVGGIDNAGSMLKSASGWNDGYNGIDAYGFSVLPAGYRLLAGGFYSEGDYAYLWSASENNSNYAWYQNFYYGYNGVSRYNNDKGHGRSLRCLKDS